MSAYLKHYSNLFRTRREAPSTPAADPASTKQVIEVSDDLDGFASVTLRPMTYAEAVRGDAPLRPAVVSEPAPFSVVDEAQWAVNEVQRYVRECESQPSPRASTHVSTNQEYLDRTDYIERQLAHSKRGRRSSKRRSRGSRR